MNKKWALLFTFLLLLCVFGTLLIGDLSFKESFQGVIQRFQGNSYSWNPILDERLPRLFITLATGASLAVSGTIMQSLFHNPLASPSILGISSGGSLLVTIVYIMGWQLTYPFSIPLAAITGCLLTLLIVYSLSQSQGEVYLNTLILTGIAISTLLIAFQAMITYALRDHWHLIQVLSEWQSGSTLDKTWKHVHMQMPLTIAALLICWKHRYEMDIISLGAEEATNLGVDVKKIRARLFFAVALLTGGSLASVGNIAFFGLIIPHLLRFIFGPKNHLLIPACIFGGAIAFSSLDLTLRFFKAHNYTIGNISAIFGGLFFLILLIKLKRKALAGI